MTFVELHNHTGVGVADLVHKYLTTKLQLDFNKCRGQSYDNAANMDDRCNGMKQKNPKKKEICKMYSWRWLSLNLVGR